MDGTREEQDNIVNNVLEIWDKVYASMLSYDEKNEPTGGGSRAASSADNSKYNNSDIITHNINTVWQMINQGSGIFQVREHFCWLKYLKNVLFSGSWIVLPCDNVLVAILKNSIRVFHFELRCSNWVYVACIIC